MYAVIKTGGKQYRISEGDTVRVEKIDAEEGAAVEFDNILMVADGDNVTIGTPYVDGGKVVATVKSHGRHDKSRVRSGGRSPRRPRQGGSWRHTGAVLPTQYIFVPRGP